MTGATEPVYTLSLRGESLATLSDGRKAVTLAWIKGMCPGLMWKESFLEDPASADAFSRLLRVAGELLRLAGTDPVAEPARVSQRVALHAIDSSSMAVSVGRAASITTLGDFLIRPGSMVDQRTARISSALNRVYQDTYPSIDDGVVRFSGTDQTAIVNPKAERVTVIHTASQTTLLDLTYPEIETLFDCAHEAP